MRLLSILLLASTIALTTASAVPVQVRRDASPVPADSLDKRGCVYNGCVCYEGSPQGQYCFQGGIYECNPEGKCCYYGRADRCQ